MRCPIAKNCLGDVSDPRYDYNELLTSEKCSKYYKLKQIELFINMLFFIISRLWIQGCIMYTLFQRIRIIWNLFMCKLL
jgi:hypothetical protein